VEVNTVNGAGKTLNRIEAHWEKLHDV